MLENPIGFQHTERSSGVPKMQGIFVQELPLVSLLLHPHNAHLMLLTTFGTELPRNRFI